MPPSAVSLVGPALPFVLMSLTSAVPPVVPSDLHSSTSCPLPLLSAAKNSAWPTTVKLVGLPLSSPEAMFFTIAVPPAVPSLRYSSCPPLAPVAAKYSLPSSSVNPSAPSRPLVITCVPAAVPLLTHGAPSPLNATPPANGARLETAPSAEVSGLVPPDVPSLTYRSAPSVKYSFPPDATSPSGLASVPRSRTIVVPAAVPSDLQSCRPCVPSSATKNSVLPTAVSLSGPASARPGLMSLTSVDVPLPSPWYSSAPRAPSLAAKKYPLPTATAGPGDDVSSWG